MSEELKHTNSPKCSGETEKAPHGFAMAGYSIACRYGVLEGRAFRLVDEMFAAFKAASPSPASDAELPKEFCEVLGGYEIWRESDVRTIWNAARAASTRTASDTRTAAGEAECDAARLAEMEARKDAAYLERNQVVAALAKCFPSGVARTAIEGWSEDWHGCVYIDMPTGQASWHFHDSQAYLFDGLPPYAGKWDGHTTEEKYERISRLAARTQADAGKAGAATQRAEGE